MANVYINTSNIGGFINELPKVNFIWTKHWHSDKKTGKNFNKVIKIQKIDYISEVKYALKNWLDIGRKATFIIWYVEYVMICWIYELFSAYPNFKVYEYYHFRQIFR